MVPMTPAPTSIALANWRTMCPAHIQTKRPPDTPTTVLTHPILLLSHWLARVAKTTSSLC